MIAQLWNLTNFTHKLCELDTHLKNSNDSKTFPIELLWKLYELINFKNWERCPYEYRHSSSKQRRNERKEVTDSWQFWSLTGKTWKEVLTISGRMWGINTHQFYLNIYINSIQYNSICKVIISSLKISRWISIYSFHTQETWISFRESVKRQENMLRYKIKVKRMKITIIYKIMSFSSKINFFNKVFFYAK